MIASEYMTHLEAENKRLKDQNAKARTMIDANADMLEAALKRIGELEAMLVLIAQKV